MRDDAVPAGGAARSRRAPPPPPTSSSVAPGAAIRRARSWRRRDPSSQNEIAVRDEDDPEQEHRGRVALARLLELEQPLPDEPDDRRGRLVRPALGEDVHGVEHLEVGDDRDHDREQEHRAQHRERDAPEALRSPSPRRPWPRRAAPRGRSAGWRGSRASRTRARARPRRARSCSSASVPLPKTFTRVDAEVREDQVEEPEVVVRDELPDQPDEHGRREQRHVEGELEDVAALAVAVEEQREEQREREDEEDRLDGVDRRVLDRAW